MSLIGNIATILRGSALAQLIGIAILPVLSRLYPADAFGIVQAAMSLLTLLLIVSSLRLEVALLSTPEPRLQPTLHCAAWLCVLVSLTACAVIAILENTGDLLSSSHAVIWLLPLIALFAGWNQLANYLALRHSAFGVASNSRVVQTGAYAAAATGAGFLWPSPLALFASDGLGRLASVAYAARRLKIGLQALLRPPRFDELKQVLGEQRELTTVGLAAALVNALGSALTALLVLWVFTAHDAGQYAIVERVVGAPIALIAGASSQVFMAHLSKALAGESPGTDARQIYRHLVLLKLKVGLLPALALFAIAPWLLPFVLGPEWQLAGEFARALSGLYLVAFVTTPVNMALTVAGRQRLQLAWDVGRLIAVAGLWIIVGYLGLDVMHTIWLHAATASACYLVYLFIADRALGRLSSASRSTA